jgi:hypothetical protein
MEGTQDRASVKKNLLLLIVKVLLGGAAATFAIALMRVVGNKEVIVALFIGLVPGLAEKSIKKAILGALFGCIGYFIGARVASALAPMLIHEAVPVGHWAVVGGFVGMTVGISRKPDQWPSFRFMLFSLGAVYGFALGLVFGLLGNTGGYMAVLALGETPLMYYAGEISLICTGMSINLAAAIASIPLGALDNGLWRVARAVEKAEE